MSVEAITWAFAQPISHSSAKFVLVVLANCADAQHFLAWPSAAYIAQSTGQDRKTVQGNLRRLKEWGYIEDSGERRGETGQIIVYRLKNCNQKTTDNLKNTPENGPVSLNNLSANTPENGPVSLNNLSANTPENGPVSLNNLSANTPENGPVLPSELSTKTPDFGPLQEAQNRNSTENGTVPFFPRKRPVFPVKEARFSRQRGPKTGHGTVIEPLTKPSEETFRERGAQKCETGDAEILGNHPPAARSDRSRATRLPTDWVLPKSWGEWALSERPDWDADKVRGIGEQFRDHWLAKGGADARKVDWLATWRNWVRREKSLSGAANFKTSATPQGRHHGISKINFREGVDENGRF